MALRLFGLVLQSKFIFLKSMQQDGFVKHRYRISHFQGNPFKSQNPQPTRQLPVVCICMLVAFLKFLQRNIPCIDTGTCTVQYCTGTETI
jgi:hypothetical protein